MGGKNHQPTGTKTFIAPSAWLSQKLGEGFIAALEANNHLENAIIVAMQRLHVEAHAAGLGGSATDHLDRAIASLTGSLKKIDEIEAAYDNLLTATGHEGYTGNPLAPSIRRFNLSGVFAGELICPDVNHQAWREVEQHISDHNILDTLRWERSRFRELDDPTRQLIAVIKECRRIVEQEGDDAFVDAVELNKLPLRQCYARVFSLWNHLDAMFLYSALMTTELFYRVSGLPSLLAPKSASIAPVLETESVSA